MAALTQRPRQDVAGPGRRQLAQNDGWNNRTGLNRDLEPNEFGPLPEDRRRIDGVADQGLKQRPGAGFLDSIELAVV